MKKNLLSIAGYDPSGGAGVLLDVRVFERLGFQGMAILTALTVQNTRKVQSVHPLAPRTLMAQYTALSRDVSFAGIKAGMLGSKANIAALARILSKHPDLPRVIDPVLRASSGAPLLSEDTVPFLLRAVRCHASLLTPNLKEASLMAGIPVTSPQDMREAARIIYERTKNPCLIKGGHLEQSAVNILYDGCRTVVYGHEKIKKDVHGTGCFLSAVVLAYLARGLSLENACGRAADLTHEAIIKAIQPGKGRSLFVF
jgi:hydroxymethylpyrimidine kinase/phosphomethylpyrimidine kinase